MTTGSVGFSSRARNAVAPNSPSETANAKPAAASSGFHTTGRSTVSDRAQRRGAERGRGLALPVVDAAEHRRERADHQRAARRGPGRWAPAAGCPAGRAGGSSRAMRKPKPTVTAETPSGSMNTASSPDRTRCSGRECDRRVTTTATRSPTPTDIQVASTAVRSEVTSACVTGYGEHLGAADGAARGGQRAVGVEAPPVVGAQRAEHQRGQRREHEREQHARWRRSRRGRRGRACAGVGTCAAGSGRASSAAAGRSPAGRRRRRSGAPTAPRPRAGRAGSW